MMHDNELATGIHIVQYAQYAADDFWCMRELKKS